MRRSRRSTRAAQVVLGLALGLGLAGASQSAQAQGMPSGRGLALGRFEPAVAGDAFHGVDFGRYSGSHTWAVRFGLLGDYTYEPLVGRTSSGAVTPIVQHRLDLHLQAAVALFNRFDINLSMPLQLLEMGPSMVDGTSLRASNSFAAGDGRIGARVRLFGNADVSPFSLHIGAQVFLGGLWNAPLSNISDGSIRARGYLVAAGRASLLRYSLQVGGIYRPTNQLDAQSPPHTTGPEVFLNAGLGLVFLRDQLMIGAEFYGSIRATDFAASNTGAFAAEGNLGVHYTIADLIRVGVSAGPGLSQAAGTPTARALLNIAYAPIDRVAPPPGIPDTDGDGVFDNEDQCVTVPMGEHPDPNRRGCPVEDRDHDTVPDADDLCVDVPQGEHPDPARRGCPLADTDGDGVFDNEDQCVSTPQGPTPDPARRGCPDGDTDNDTVLNSQDQCPDVPQGANPDPDRRGCPIPDRDRDTVPDNVDHCPDQPGAPNPNPRLNGCPGLVVVQDGLIRINRPVFFATNRDTILPRSFPVLTAVRDAVLASPQIHRVSIEGHTDDAGRDDRNMDLSTRRAASVLRWLTVNGIEADRLESHGFGETRPAHDVTGLRGRQLAAARAENRRVDFRILR